jgi:hypothetical protein
MEPQDCFLEKSLRRSVTLQSAEPFFQVGEILNHNSVYQLYNQGQRISQIAASLRLTVEAVNGYLGITSSSK